MKLYHGHMHLINKDCVCSNIIRSRLCIIYGFLIIFFQKSLFTENYFLIAVINLTTWGLLYTCLVFTTIIMGFHPCLIQKNLIPSLDYSSPASKIFPLLPLPLRIPKFLSHPQSRFGNTIPYQVCRYYNLQKVSIQHSDIKVSNSMQPTFSYLY